MTKMNRNYYKVVAKCGHVGRCKYIPIIFAVVAENGKEASKLVRQYPRVKHNHKDAILRCDEITFEEFLQIKETNNNDPYLHCRNKQEQNMFCDLQDRIEEDSYKNKSYKKEDRLSRVTYKLAKCKIINDFNKKEYEYDYVY